VPATGLSFRQQQAVEGGELVGSYSAALPGRRPRQLVYRRPLSVLHGDGGFSYSVHYRL
jgi:hypothetical protein